MLLPAWRSRSASELVSRAPAIIDCQAQQADLVQIEELQLANTMMKGTTIQAHVGCGSARCAQILSVRRVEASTT